MTAPEIAELVTAAVALASALAAYIRARAAHRSVQLHMQWQHRVASPTARQTGGNSND